MMEDFLTEQEDIENRIPQLKRDYEEKSNATDEVNEWIRLIGQFSNTDKLDRNIITQLIDSITVSERKQVDGRWEQSIDIEYRFIGNLLNESENKVKKENLYEHRTRNEHPRGRERIEPGGHPANGVG